MVKDTQKDYCCPNCGCNPQDEPYCMEPTHCPKCGYSFGGSEEEKKGLSTKSKVATGIGAVAGAAAGIGMRACRRRKAALYAAGGLPEQIRPRQRAGAEPRYPGCRQTLPLPHPVRAPLLPHAP